MTAQDVVIVSAWGRGTWLTHQLQQKGFSTTVLDVSSLLPSMSSTQREGPFGVFLPSGLSDLQKQYLSSDNFYTVEQGFSVFTSQGPVEFQGPLKSFFMKQRKDFQLLYLILSDLLETTYSSLLDREQKTQVIKKLEDSESFIRLAVELGSSYLNLLQKEQLIKKILELLRSKKKPISLDQLFRGGNKACLFSPLFSDYILREASQKYFAEVKNSLQKEGVQWVDIPKEDAHFSLTDFNFTKDYVQLNLNNKAEKFQFLIWTLSGPETLRCFSSEMPVLFPEWEEPVKIWRPFSLLWDQGGFESIIPSLLTILPASLQKAGEKTGSHEIISLKKYKSVSHIDMWTLCPYAQRFDKQVLSSCLDSALDRLRSIFPYFSINGVLPETSHYQEYYVQYEYKTVLKKSRFYNKVHPCLFHLNPEAAGKMDAYSLMQQSDRILKVILDKK